MPGIWRRGIVATALGLVCYTAGPAAAQTRPAPIPFQSSFASPAVPVSTRPPALAVSTTPPTALPPVDTAEGPVRDLTPPNWPVEPHAAAGLHEGPGHVPGHLSPIASEEGGLVLNIDYLLLRPRRGALDFAVNDPNRDLVSAGKVESLNYELRSGVRAGLGYHFAETKWDVLAEYTYLRSSTSANLAASPQGVLYPTITRPGLIDEAQFVQAQANFEYNVFDAVLGRRFALDEHFGVRMFAGFRFANIRQTETVAFDGLDARASQTISKNSFDGFGPIFGGEAVLAGWRGFHLYGKASGGLLTGRTRNPLIETNNTGGTQYVNLEYDTRKVIPVAGVGLGAGWQYRQFSLRVGYEITNYFGLIDQPRQADDVSRGKILNQPSDLSLEGIFTQLGFTF